MTVSILCGDARKILQMLERDSVQCCVTSPPYFGLRSYLPDGHADKPKEIGLEPSPDAYITELVEVFRQVRRVLRDDGTLWLNLGDSYARGFGGGSPGAKSASNVGSHANRAIGRTPEGFKDKDLLMIPARVAIALQADGWWLRSDIIWCLSAGAWVYARTQKGDMPVMVKDLVRLRPETVQLWNGEKWTRVIGWGASNNTTERLELVLRSGERVGCTGGHLWPTQRGNVAARDLRPGDVILSCHLPEPDGAARPHYLTDRLAWLLGLYLAEGSRSDDTIQLALHADESRWIPEIAAAAADLGATCTHTLSGNLLSLRLYGRLLVAFLEDFIDGSGASGKHLRAPAWRFPNAVLRKIADGYLAGDGHEDGGRIRLGFARNYALERDLRTLAARLGATLTLKPITAKYQGGERPAFKGEWRWTRSGHRNEKDRGEIVEIRNSRARQFWDIAVADEPHLFALASGVLTHNCKPNPMPESVTDRPTSAHEHVFLLTKSARYFYDAEAVKEPAVADHPSGNGFKRDARKSFVNADGTARGSDDQWSNVGGTRNLRNVWTIATQPFAGAHFATMPPDLVERCIKAGSRPGDMILDPFGGAGTTGLVADRLNRHATLIELNTNYAQMAKNRITQDNPLFITTT